MISAKTNLVGLPGGPYIRCVLVAGTDFDDAIAAPPTTLATQIVHRFAKPGSVDLRCWGIPSGTGPSLLGAILANTKITAIRVAALHNKPAQ